MPLVSGTKLGPYEIAEPLGAGGMGEVYRGRDTRLGRDVALKILSEAFASDTERMARFEREAKVLASLNHANIASIYGLEESNGTRALVMELVEGSTLAERIKQEGMPLEEVLPIAKQICEGLEYAHERGIIHRDLKPANVKITSDGAVKLLDFGLAKALECDTTAATFPSSPTFSRLATQAGIILGTAAYMSPEQAKGKSVDRRTDIWAFGCVLYEMLTGEHPFDGETVTEVLAAVVRAEPEWSQLPTTTPDRVRELLRRCLKKDARQRLQAIGDARIALDEAQDAGEPSGRAHVPPSWRGVLPWVGATVLTLIAAIAVYIVRSPNPSQTIVSEISAPQNTSFVFRGNFGGLPVLSPDGQRLVFVAAGSDKQQRLWVRQLSAATAQPLEGTEGAMFPFWSPDSRSLGFFANGNLNRIDATGGPAIAIAEAPLGRGGAWSSDGTILYTPGTTTPIYRVAASGGTPQPVTKLSTARLETTHRWPQFLPDGKHFLFFARSTTDQNNATYAASVNGGEPKLLIRGDTSAVYAPPGYLLFVRQGTLMAQRFDADNMTLIGDAMPLAKNVEVNLPVWRGAFTVSENGLLVYHTESATQNTRLLWFDRTGKQMGETGAPGDYGTLSLSPDGRRLAVTVRASSLNIWVYDLLRGIPTRLTFSTGTNAQPWWAANGRTIVFVSDQGGQTHLYEKPADGTGTASPLVVDDAQESLPSFSSDGRYLIFERQAASHHLEIWSLPLFGDRKAFPVIQNQQFNMLHPALSPDGKWLAYMSAESGRPEVYVVPFVQGSGKWLVSTAGGRFPRWRHDGRELFYISLDNKIISAEIAVQGTSLVIGKVTPLFQANPVSSAGWTYDVSSDGKKLVVVSEANEKTAEPLTLISNWPALLKKE
jgi:serine/threonine protein kinase/WD40 repeat protein